MQLIAAITAWAAGEPVDVSAACRKAHMSRKTFYKWAARYKTEGLAGLNEQSRRPHSIPNRTPTELEQAVVDEHARLQAAGLDHGAATIQWHLGNTLGSKVPSRATIHRILVRHGRVTPSPRKRPKRTYRRFEAGAPNERWQIDSTEVTIETGRVFVFNIIDDHSRVLIRSRAVTNPTSEQAWHTFCEGAQAWGVPAGVLSDNGLCFSGKLRQFEVFFEHHLRDAGVRPMTGRPFHPQTTGKVERFQQTLKKWLTRQGLARDITELQARLDEFARIYNNERPHQGIGRVTPAERWHANDRARPASTPLEHPHYPDSRVHHVRVDRTGVITLPDIRIAVGARHIGHEVTVLVDDHYATVFHNGDLVRHLHIDHTRSYQALHPRPGRPRVAS